MIDIPRAAPVVMDLWNYEEATKAIAADDELRAAGGAGLPAAKRLGIEAVRIESVKRIQACLNACHGMPTQVLEDSGVGCVRDTIDELTAALNKAKGEKRIITPGQG